MIAGAGILLGACLLSAPCLLALSALAPTSALAKTGKAPSPASKAPRTTADFSLQASNGYVIDVSAQSGDVTLQASTGRPQGDFSLSSYSVKGPRSPSPIDASFGALGEISVSFEPSGKVEVVRFPKEPKGCHSPRKIVRRLGTFTGTIRFEGEGGYTSVDATSAEGSVGPPNWSICFLQVKPHAGGDHPPRHHRPARAAYLGATNSKNTVSFSAFTVRSKPEASFSAQSATKSGTVSILRVLLARAPKSSFIFDNSLSSATVSPPLPFTGSAEFRRGANPLSGSWAGSLAVSFPGAEGVPLTGSGFTALLQRQ